MAFRVFRRALWRVRLVAFRVFRKSAHGIDRALCRVRLYYFIVAFRVFRRVRRGAHPKSARGIRPSPLEGAFSGV